MFLVFLFLFQLQLLCTQLDITFDLISSIFKPYTRLGNTSEYVNRVDKLVIIKHLTQYIIVWLHNATIPRKPREERRLQLSYILTHSLNAKEIQEEEMSYWSQI